MNLGWLCMSWRQPATIIRASSAADATTRMTRNEGEEEKDAVLSPVLCALCPVLILHLHDRQRRETLEKCPGIVQLELRIRCLQAQEELVAGCAVAEVGRVEERMIRLGQAVEREHAEGRRETGVEDRPLVGGDGEGRPGVVGTSGDV